MKLKSKTNLYTSTIQIAIFFIGALLLISPVSAAHRQHRGHHARDNCNHRESRYWAQGFWFNFGPPAGLTTCSAARGGHAGCCNSDRVWINGYWDWFDGGYFWVEGFWSVRPEGSYWVKGHWQRRGGRRVWEPAHWSRK